MLADLTAALAVMPGQVPIRATALTGLVSA